MDWFLPERNVNLFEYDELFKLGFIQNGPKGLQVHLLILSNPLT